MNRKFARLDQDFVLRGWLDHPFTVVSRTKSLFFNFDDTSSPLKYILSSCDGLHDFESPAYLPVHRKILNKLIDFKVVQECEEGESLLSIQKYRYVDALQLIELHWAVTGNCNMHCRHCFMESPRGKYGEPKTREMLEVVKKLARANIPRVSLTGGEALLRKDFHQLIRHLSENQISVSEIVTNGLLLDDSIYETLDRYGQYCSFQISFDGIGAHDQIRGLHGIEGKIRASVEKACASGHPVNISTVLMQNNIDTLRETYEWIKGLKNVVWLPGRVQHSGLWKDSQEGLSADELGNALLALQKLWLEEERPVRIIFDSFYNGAQETEKASGSPFVHHELKITPESPECTCIQWKLFLLPDGRLIPCTGFAGSEIEKDMPNLFTAELTDILSGEAPGSEKLMAFRKCQKEVRMSGIPECAECDFLELCGCGCSAYALSENRSIMAPDPVACAVYKGGWKKRFENAAVEYQIKKQLKCDKLPEYPE